MQVQLLVADKPRLGGVHTLDSVLSGVVTLAGHPAHPTQNALKLPVPGVFLILKAS